MNKNSGELLKLTSSKGKVEFRLFFEESGYRYEILNGRGRCYRFRSFEKALTTWVDRPSCKAEGILAEDFLKYCLASAWMNHLRKNGIITIHQLDQYDKNL